MTQEILMVIPTLGRRNALLRGAMSSIRSQGLQVDIVVVAPDLPGVRQVIDEFGGRFVVDPARGGQSGALNAGLEAALPSAKYFAWLCDDDLLNPGALRAAKEALDRRPDASMVYGWCDYIDESGTVLFSSRAGRLAAWIQPWGPNLVPQPGSLMRLRSVREVGGIDESCRLAMDLDLFLRLRKAGPVLSLPQTLAQFRWHGDSLTVANEAASMDEADSIRQRHLSSLGAVAYPIVRRPSRWALRLAKRRVQARSNRRAAVHQGHP